MENYYQIEMKTRDMIKILTGSGKTEEQAKNDFDKRYTEKYING